MDPAAFFSDFDGPAWTTLGTSVVALIASGFAAWRTRAPRPRWEFVKVIEEEHEGNTPMYVPELDDGLYPGDSWWRARIQQIGPGDALAVEVTVHTPQGYEWSSSTDKPVTVRTGGVIDRFLCGGDKERGEYRIVVQYRSLPNSKKRREWKHRVILD
ncbi:hypothetical protein [Microbacterium sp.]|uniref:hypothetical protein n=1 Tax=Microbacterium sp. TaxID=51671 RepID=UPI0026350865|nr:hypothetical protein [Microbacterium sp.]